LNKLIWGIVFLLPLAASLTRAADVTPHSVLAHANDQQFWVARIDHFPSSSDQTLVYYRLVGQDDKWQKLCMIPARVEQIAAQGLLGAALLNDGSWLLIYTDGSTVTAGPLPASGKMVALAGGKTWWAIGEVAGGLPAAQASKRRTSGTRPATREATTQSPETSSRSSAPQLVLFELVGNDWTAIAELPANAPELPRVSLSIIDEVAYIATFERDLIQVYHLDRQKWMQDLHLPGMGQTASFALLEDSGPAHLWVQQQSGPDLLYLLSNASAKPLQLQPPPDIPSKDRTVALFSGSLRMIGRSKDGLIEQRYSISTGQPEGKPTELSLPPVSTVLDIQGMQTLVAIGALLLIMLGWFRQQNAAEEKPANLESVTLAPLGRRVAAGLIDAAPVILTMLVFIIRDRQNTNASMQSRQLMLLLAYWSSGVFFILFTTLVETAAGRSLGKILLGLRVVTTEGQTPTTGALVIRNLLRIFDVSLFFLPLIAVALFPLRQRAADLAAGTLVVLNDSATDQKQDPPK
jgi:uncharacterized RDD family membrane protein YckC